MSNFNFAPEDRALAPNSDGKTFAALVARAEWLVVSEGLSQSSIADLFEDLTSLNVRADHLALGLGEAAKFPAGKSRNFEDYRHILILHAPGNQALVETVRALAPQAACLELSSELGFDELRVLIRAAPRCC